MSMPVNTVHTAACLLPSALRRATRRVKRSIPDQLVASAQLILQCTKDVVQIIRICPGNPALLAAAHQGSCPWNTLQNPLSITGQARQGRMLIGLYLQQRAAEQTLRNQARLALHCKPVYPNV